jgi:hypothetical protein
MALPKYQKGGPFVKLSVDREGLSIRYQMTPSDLSSASLWGVKPRRPV